MICLLYKNLYCADTLCLETLIFSSVEVLVTGLLEVQPRGGRKDQGLS